MSTSDELVRRRSSALSIWRYARVGLFLAMVAAAVATRSPWAFGAVFAFGLAGCLDAARSDS